MKPPLLNMALTACALSTSSAEVSFLHRRELDVLIVADSQFDGYQGLVDQNEQFVTQEWLQLCYSTPVDKYLSLGTEVKITSAPDDCQMALKHDFRGYRRIKNCLASDPECTSGIDVVTSHCRNMKKDFLEEGNVLKSTSQIIYLMLGRNDLKTQYVGVYDGNTVAQQAYLDLTDMLRAIETECKDISKVILGLPFLTYFEVATFTAEFGDVLRYLEFVDGVQKAEIEFLTSFDDTTIDERRPFSIETVSLTDVSDPIDTADGIHFFPKYNKYNTMVRVVDRIVEALKESIRDNLQVRRRKINRFFAIDNQGNAEVQPLGEVSEDVLMSDLESQQVDPDPVDNDAGNCTNGTNGTNCTGNEYPHSGTGYLYLVAIIPFLLLNAVLLYIDYGNNVALKKSIITIQNMVKKKKSTNDDVFTVGVQTVHVYNSEQNLTGSVSNASSAEKITPNAIISAAMVDTSNTKATPIQPKRIRIKGLDGLRFLAALHIFLFHMYQNFSITYIFETPSTISDVVVDFSCAFCGFGKYWVIVFFTLSGFVLSYSRKDSDTKTYLNFLTDRLIPILSLLFISNALALIVSLTQNNNDSVEAILLTIFQVQVWTPPYNYLFNGPTWFISNIIVFWCLFPFWQRALKSLQTNFQVFAIMAAVYLISYWPTIMVYLIFDMPLYDQYYSNNIHAFIEFNPFNNWYSFMFGMVIAVAFKKIESDNLKKQQIMRELDCEDPEANHQVLFQNTFPKAHFFVQNFGGTLCLSALSLFFALSKSPGFQMGTYYLMFSKGPASLPFIMLLILVLYIDAGTQGYEKKSYNTYIFDYGKEFLFVFDRFGKFALALYLLHVPLSDLLLPNATSLVLDANNYSVWDAVYTSLWLKPFLVIMIAFAICLFVELPIRDLYIKKLSKKWFALEK